MLTAWDAKQKTQEYARDFREECYEIEGLIEKAILSGHFYVVESGYINPAMKRHLENLGYIVKTGTQYNEPYYSISWK